jgi:hypothetical protein
MQNPTPAQIIVPAVGAPTCRGIALRLVSLTPYERETDRHLECDMLIRVCADRAVRDGAVLCLRPTADRPACVGLTATAFAVASLQEDFAARALVVDPYDAEGNDIREAPQTFMAMTWSQSKDGFKTRAGAERWLARKVAR